MPPPALANSVLTGGAPVVPAAAPQAEPLARAKRKTGPKAGKRDAADLKAHNLLTTLGNVTFFDGEPNSLLSFIENTQLLIDALKLSLAAVEVADQLWLSSDAKLRALERGMFIL